MKFTSAVILAGLAARAKAGQPASAGGGGSIATCGDQAPCLKFSIHEVDGDKCDDSCYYKVCMEFDTSPTECKKKDTISHSCVKDTSEDICHDATGFAGVSKDENLANGYTQCQQIAPGNTAEFYLKDAKDCTGTEAEKPVFALEDTYIASCSAMGDTYVGDNLIAGCGGQAHTQTACIWRITVPEDCTESEIVTDVPVPVETTTEASPETTPEASTTTEAPPVAPPKESGGGGDPHFARWGLEHDSFHGECDIVLVHSEDFHNGAGFDLHARTTIQDYFSYIETMAMKVGDDVLELHNDRIYLNGEVFTSADLPMTFGGEFKYTISNARIESGKNPKFYQYYKVDLHEDSSVLFKFYKKFLTYQISGHVNDFQDSVGLMGEYHTGEMIGRDGRVMESFDEFGFEWQVQPTDAVLFSEVRSPQLPYEQCRMPTAARPARRVLRNSAIMNQAQEACAHITGNDYNLCLDDVAMTGDVGIASLW